MKHKRIHIVIAAGGTGGHIIPAIALKDNLINLGHKVTFITDKRFENYGFKEDDNFIKLDIPKFSKNPFKLIHFAFKVLALSLRVSNTFNKIKPGIIIGFGGYPTLPALIAGWLNKIKMAIHEQNTVLGRSNKLFLPFVKVVATTFPDIINFPNKHRNKLFLTGMPIRSEIEAIASLPYPAINENTKLNILVIGGSQGAKVFADVVPEAISMLDKNQRARLRINQQCHSADEISSVEERYKSMGVNAEVSLFFKDMPHKIAPAHLVISRAGASSVSEMLLCNKPCVLVPYPHAKDNHQLYNAKHLENIGLAWVIEQSYFSAESLSNIFRQILINPEILHTKSETARNKQTFSSTSSLANMLVVEATQD
ncbi:MAG: undecaprenyldiphospho-muramoylpentapeptide beta-N-acetylglucosaminyltransferase [Alphaproteobacteria bacterium 33-17]|nr:MAG: undecaprenyldiphospho-muramoylpentapeptide beta-N-acetylglucosaminyltransferase [Alphaproteobacteria bacterium 33-17]